MDSDFVDSLCCRNPTTKPIFLNILDHYKLNERAAKYAILFILIPFITLFLFEQFFRDKAAYNPLHPSGIANIIFYLLLLSMSEHISLTCHI